MDERAVRASVGLVEQINAADLGRSTPCAGWNLADLLAHMAVQHDGFAAAAGGAGDDPAVWHPRPLTDPAREYVAAAERVIAAFRPDDVLTRRFTLIEISTSTTFSGRTAIGFHCIDYVVHAWDVARSLGCPITLDADLADVAFAIASAVPDGPQRLEPGAAFRPAVRLQPASEGSTMDRVVAMLGRDPAWTPPSGPAR